MKVHWTPGAQRPFPSVLVPCSWERACDWCCLGSCVSLDQREVGRGMGHLAQLWLQGWHRRQGSQGICYTWISSDGWELPLGWTHHSSTAFSWLIYKMRPRRKQPKPAILRPKDTCQRRISVSVRNITPLATSSPLSPAQAAALGSCWMGAYDLSPSLPPFLLSLIH